MGKISALILFAMILTASPAAMASKYIYLHTEGEYSIELPDAPAATTIWGDDTKIPYLENPPKFGPLGEKINLKQVDPETGDIFNVDIVFLKASRDYLLSLKPDKMLDLLYADYADVQLENMKPGYAPGSDTLKWSTLTGYSTGKDNRPLFNASHFLAGTQSIMVVKVHYNLQNQAFNELYKKLSASIKYNQP